MTDQPAAAPTPGDWKIRGEPGDGFPPDIVSETGRGHFEVEILARTFANVPKFSGTPEELWANAKLFASAKATAVERDRLKVVNEGLVKALETLRPMCGAPHDYTIADVWKAQRFADAVLDEARK